MNRAPVYLVIPVIVGGFALSVLLTYWIKRYVEALGVWDTPNSRSSHATPVPRGGGLSIVILTLLSSVFFVVMLGAGGILWPLILITIVLATTGWWDDRRGLSAGIRITIYVITALYAIRAFGGFASLEIGGAHISLGGFAVPFTVMWIVWLINLYNFMDGIDGIAATQSAVAGCTLGIWFTIHQNYVIALFCYVIMTASLGFLVWNWAPARIFMGDVGSVTLGGIFAVLALVGEKRHNIPLGACIILLGLFITDATVTLLNRVFRGERVWEAHRSHFYQRAVLGGLSHAQVTGGAALVSILLAVFATMEMLRVSPRWIWPSAALIVLLGLAISIVRRENISRVVDR